MPTLVIADDSEAVRKALRNFFAGHSEFQILGEARDYAETITLVTELKPNLLLTDLRMPGLESRATEIAKLAEECRCPVIVMSFAADAEARSLAASTGATRLVDKTKLYETLIPTIEEVLREHGPAKSR
jgi:DNA-binding NarL/FixJ family response regulator